MYQIYKADTGISTCCLLIAIVFSVLLIWCCWFGSLPCKQEVFGWKLQKSIFFKITSSTAVFLLLFFFFLSYALLPRKFEGKGNLLYLKSSSYSGKHFPPEGLNHVHSSHLFSFTQRIMASGGQKSSESRWNPKKQRNHSHVNPSPKEEKENTFNANSSLVKPYDQEVKGTKVRSFSIGFPQQL